MIPYARFARDVSTERVILFPLRPSICTGPPPRCLSFMSRLPSGLLLFLPVAAILSGDDDSYDIFHSPVVVLSLPLPFVVLVPSVVVTGPTHLLSTLISCQPLWHVRWLRVGVTQKDACCVCNIVCPVCWGVFCLRLVFLVCVLLCGLLRCPPCGLVGDRLCAGSRCSIKRSRRWKSWNVAASSTYCLDFCCCLTVNSAIWQSVDPRVIMCSNCT